MSVEKLLLETFQYILQKGNSQINTEETDEKKEELLQKIQIALTDGDFNLNANRRGQIISQTKDRVPVVHFAKTLERLGVKVISKQNELMLINRTEEGDKTVTIPKTSIDSLEAKEVLFKLGVNTEEFFKIFRRRPF